VEEERLHPGRLMLPAGPGLRAGAHRRGDRQASFRWAEVATHRQWKPICWAPAAGGVDVETMLADVPGASRWGGPGHCACPRRQPASRLLVARARPKGFRQHLASRPSHCDVCHQALGRQPHRATDNARAARQLCVARAAVSARHAQQLDPRRSYDARPWSSIVSSRGTLRLRRVTVVACARAATGQGRGDGETGHRGSALDREGRERLPDRRPVVEQQLTRRGVESHFPAGLPTGLELSRVDR
jgi:hypothetical protein